jgi:hypothetical protein
MVAWDIFWIMVCCSLKTRYARWVAWRFLVLAVFGGVGGGNSEAGFLHWAAAPLRSK